MWGFLGLDLVMLRRFDEAREAYSHVAIFRWGNLAYLEMAAGRLAVADSIITRNLDEARVNEETPGVGRALLGQVQYARGSLRVSAANFAQAVAQSNTAGDGTLALFWTGWAVEMACMSGGAFPLPQEPQPRDTTPMGVVTRGLWATVGGDRALARRCAAEARAIPVRRLADQGSAPLVLRARVALLESRPREAIDLLRETAAAPVEFGLPNNGRGLTLARWTIADAFEASGQPDSAAAYLERELVIPYRPDLSPCIHHRLALLHAHLGRVAAAERHLAAAERAWDRPDPKVRLMLGEARAAVMSLRAMAPRKG
jgi:tetratricopeptide (TPR) repeat protein